MRRTVFSAVSMLIAGCGFLTALPAHAAASPSTVALSCNSSNVMSAGGQSTVNVTAQPNDTITISNVDIRGFAITPDPLPSGYSLTGGKFILSDGSKTLTVGAASTTLTVAPDAGQQCVQTGTWQTASGSVTINITVGSGGGSSSSDSSTPSVETSTPSVETLSLSLAASGATCTGGNPTGYAGTWLTLPSADQCTQSGPTAKSGAKLLGWATSSSFPVARAQAQVDKKWGVIDEVIDGERMIFIPGGMATFVSGSNNLFPIWSA
ncbi:unannotated protein [freshwater metagenome]|uniref:Unannotated protein n=1 Tax=freshwater metagenome TaxID=449393 RepID=A0A6J6P4R5_9ZZZZ